MAEDAAASMVPGQRRVHHFVPSLRGIRVSPTAMSVTDVPKFPLKAEMELFDLSPYLRPGQNKIAFTQIDSMVDYVLVLHGHYPTPAQIAPVRARWDERKRFREQLAWLARPISPGI